MYKIWGQVPYHNDYGEQSVATRYVYDNEWMALDVQEPIENNKIALVSWRLCGSEFVKECIRENFPEYCKQTIWCKAHGILPEDVTKKFQENGTKIIVVIMDPRDAAANILHYNNGMFFDKEEYDLEESDNYNTKDFLDAVAEKQMEFIHFYQEKFGENCFIARYEDACYKQSNLLSHLSNFFRLPSLGIDDTQKYKSCIHKNIGDFGLYFSKEDLEEHEYNYDTFYLRYGYNNLDYKKDINYDMFIPISTKLNYLDFLKRNHMILDESLVQRIISNNVKIF